MPLLAFNEKQAGPQARFAMADIGVGGSPIIRRRSAGEMKLSSLSPTRECIFAAVACAAAFHIYSYYTKRYHGDIFSSTLISPMRTRH